MLYFFIWWTQLSQTLALNFCNPVPRFNLATIYTIILISLFFLNILIWLIIKSSTESFVCSSSWKRDVWIFRWFWRRAFATCLARISFKLKAFGGGILIIMESYFLQDFRFLLVIVFNNRNKSRQIWTFFFGWAYFIYLVFIAGSLRRCLVTICCWN